MIDIVRSSCETKAETAEESTDCDPGVRLITATDRRTEILQRGRSSIASLIQSGRLAAYDAAPEGKHRQWRVTPESLDKFRSQNAPKPTPKRARKLPAVVRQYV